MSPEDAPALAEFMCHSSEEQQATYNDLQKTFSHIRISNIVKKLLVGGELSSVDFKEAHLGIFYIAIQTLVLLS